MATVEVGAAMRWARLAVRNGDIHRDEMCLYERLLVWQRDGVARVTLSAFQKALRMGRSQVVAGLARLAERGRITKQRQRVWVAALRKYVQGVNLYFLHPVSESRGRTAHIQAEKNAKEQSPCQGQFTGLSPELSTGLTDYWGRRRSKR